MKHLLFFTLVLFALSADAINFRKESKYVYGKYGLQSYPLRKNYAVYLGKVFTYLPATPSLQEEKDQHFIGVPGEEYQIVNITTKHDGKPDMDIVVHYYRAADDDKYRANNPPYRNRISNYEKTTSVFLAPFVFMDEVKQDISDAIGKRIYSDDVENYYEVVDAKFEMFNDTSKHPSVVYYVKNSKTEAVSRIENMNRNYHGIEEIVFEKKNTIYLTKVEKPVETSERFGDITTVEMKDDLWYQYKDSIVSLKVRPFIDKKVVEISSNSVMSGEVYSNLNSPNGFAIEISNNSKNTIKILWDEAVFVGVDGLTSKIIHSGIKFNDKEQSQVPSSIIRGATLVDEIIPSNNISFKEDRLLGKREWVASPLFDNLTPISQPLSMRVMLPIQIKDVVNEYILEFEVDYVYSFPYTIRKKK